MSIECRSYNESHQTEWDNFIDSNKRNATFLHSRKFFLHNPQNAIDDASLMFYKKNKLRAVLPACLYKKDGKVIFHSHLRSTYGGFVIDESVGVREAMEMVKSTISFAKSKEANEIIVRNPFRIFYQLPSDETDYAMWHYGFKIKSRELECVIKIDELSFARYERGSKSNTKKSREHVIVKETDEFEVFWNILDKNLSDKHTTTPTHTIQDFLQLKKLVGDDKIKMFGGFINEVFVCGVIIFICNSVTVHAQYIASDLDYQDKRPVNGVIDFIIKWANKKGYLYFNLGTPMEESGKKINYGLTHFKEGFGARGILRETMHLILD